MHRSINIYQPSFLVNGIAYQPFETLIPQGISPKTGPRQGASAVMHGSCIHQASGPSEANSDFVVLILPILSSGLRWKKINLLVRMGMGMGENGGRMGENEGEWG